MATRKRHERASGELKPSRIVLRATAAKASKSSPGNAITRYTSAIRHREWPEHKTTRVRSAPLYKIHHSRCNELPLTWRSLAIASFMLLSDGASDYTFSYRLASPNGSVS